MLKKVLVLVKLVANGPASATPQAVPLRRLCKSGAFAKNLSTSGQVTMQCSWTPGMTAAFGGSHLSVSALALGAVELYAMWWHRLPQHRKRTTRGRFRFTYCSHIHGTIIHEVRVQGGKPSALYLNSISSTAPLTYHSILVSSRAFTLGTSGVLTPPGRAFRQRTKKRRIVSR